MKEFWKRQLLYCLSIFVPFSICYVFQKSGILLILKKKKKKKKKPEAFGILLLYLFFFLFGRVGFFFGRLSRSYWKRGEEEEIASQRCVLFIWTFITSSRFFTAAGLVGGPSNQRPAPTKIPIRKMPQTESTNEIVGMVGVAGTRHPSSLASL